MDLILWTTTLKWSEYNLGGSQGKLFGHRKKIIKTFRVVISYIKVLLPSGIFYSVYISVVVHEDDLYMNKYTHI